MPKDICSVPGCGQTRRKRTWCNAHYSQWRRKGEVKPFRYKWATEWKCVFCGSDVEKGSRRRRYCSSRCQVLFTKYGGKRPDTVDCVRCGSAIDLRELTKAGQFRRLDVKMCATCRRSKSLRHKVSVTEVAQLKGTNCGICSRPVDMALRYPAPDSPSIDHIVPYSHGGSHDLENLSVVHLRCNHIKSDREGFALLP